MFFLPDFLVLGSLGFWVLVSIFFLLEVIWVSCERYGWATFMLIVFGIAGYFSLGNTVRLLFINNWHMLLIFAGSYIVAGVIWAFVRWYLYCAKRSRIYETCRDIYYTNNGIAAETSVKSLPNDQRETLISQINRKLDGDSIYSIKDIVPNASQNKSRITAWMTWWVFDLINTVLHDMIHDLIDAIYHNIKNMMQQVANRCFAKFKNDM